MLIKEMRKEDKPRERFAEAPKKASLTDLVAILLRTGRPGCSVMELAGEVVNQIVLSAEINGFDDLDWRDLTIIKGIGPDKAVTICAAVELGRRLATVCKKTSLSHFGSAEAVANYFMENLRHENQEHFLVCFVNAKNRFLGYKEIGMGNMNSAPVDIKEAMRWAIRFKANGIILVHNHPSGYPDPSDSDIQLTKRFNEAAALLDVLLLDHVIIGDSVFYSFHENGWI